MQLVTVKSNLGTSLEIKLKSIHNDNGIPKGTKARITRVATKEIQESLANNFEKESYGKDKWVPLKPWYAEWKKKHGFSNKKLQQTGEMRKQILSGKAIVSDSGKMFSITYSVFMKGNVYKYMVPLTGAHPGQKQSVVSKRIHRRRTTMKVKELGTSGGTGFIPQRRWDYLDKKNLDVITLTLSNAIADEIGKK